MNNSSADQNIEQIRNEVIVLLEKENFSELIEKLEVLVSLDDPWGMHYLASCYSNGIGVEVNPEISNQLYIKAAERDFIDSQAVLGHKYLFGFQIDKDINTGMKFLKLAASANNAYSNLLLAEQYFEGNAITAKDPNIGLIYMEKAVELGDHRAKQKLAYFYSEGLYLAQDIEKSLNLNIEAADEGNEYAALNAGNAFRYGRGADIDYKKAMHYFQLASKANIVMAIHNLGTLYFNGQGTEKNIDKAWEYYIRAASFGSYLSSSNLSKMQINGDRGKKDILKAISWSLVAIEQGSNEAIKDINTFKKDLTKDDHHQIIENLKFLSENGFPWAFLALHRIYLYGTFSEINLDLAKEFKEKAEKAEIKKQDYFSIQN